METPKTRDAISEEFVNDELFLYDEDSGEVHCLNSGAAMVWLLIDGERDAKGIAAEISTVSEMSKGQIVKEVKQAISDFQEQGLLFVEAAA